MVDVVKAAFDVPFDKPFRARPCLHLLQSGVASMVGPEPVGARTEAGFVVGFKDEAHHFLQQLVAPVWDAEWAFSPPDFFGIWIRLTGVQTYASRRMRAIMRWIFSRLMPSAVSPVMPGVIAPLLVEIRP